MHNISVKVAYDTNYIKYIAIIRKETVESIKEIEKKIVNVDAIFVKDKYDIEELKEIINLVEKLINKGAKVRIYRGKELVDISILHNLLESFKIIAKQTQYEIDKEVEEEELTYVDLSEINI